MRCTTRTRFQFCSSRRLLLTFERATCSSSAISSACIRRPSRKSSAWICDTVRFTPQRQPISPQCSTKRRPTAPIVSARGSARSFAACAIEILDNRLLLSYISVKTEITEHHARRLKMTTLVLGGAGFIGRHVAAALVKRGHSVVIGSRHPSRAPRRLPASLHGCERREVHLERLGSPEAWNPLLRGVDTVVNAVGILRERGAETYERVHHHAPAALAAACARGAIRACGSNYSIVRPSLLDGEGGYGALWFRRVARWPVHFLPADARGRIDALDVGELGEAIAALCEKRDARGWHEVELGGGAPRSFGDYLAALRPAALRPAPRITVPAWLARLAGHLFDLVHFSPLSFGHIELMRRDNVPHPNRLSALLGREPARIGSAPRLLAPAGPGLSAAYGWRAVLRNVIPFFVLLAAAPLLNRWSPAAPWLLSPLIGLFAYRIAIVMHDCLHRSLRSEEHT